MSTRQRNDFSAVLLALITCGCVFGNEDMRAARRFTAPPAPDAGAQPVPSDPGLCPQGMSRWSMPLDIVRTNNAEGVILPADAATSVLCQCSRSTPGLADGYWNPSVADVAELEAALPAFIAMQRTTANLERSQRQYLGVLRGTQRAIYVNLFPRSDSDHWRTGVVTVCDGGPAFFGAEYNLDTQRFTHVDFNGSV